MNTKTSILFLLAFRFDLFNACPNHLDFCEEKELPQRTKRSFIAGKDQQRLAKSVTNTLDDLFGPNYNRQFRPGFENSATTVVVNLAIRSMGPVDDNREEFTFDCYFRQQWIDQRLKFNNTYFDELPMNWKFLQKMWRPDTYFLNGKDSYLHKISVPNRFVRISPNGRISYSQRLTVSAQCKMNLRKFPMDSQICPLEIGSFGHAGFEMQYV